MTPRVTTQTVLRFETEAGRSLLRELKELDALHDKIASLLPARAPEPEQHWWAQPGQPLPDNPAPDTLSTAAWRKLVQLGHQHRQAWRRLQWLLVMLRTACDQAVSDAAQQLSDDVLHVGHVLHTLGPQQDALDCLSDLHEDADTFVDLSRARQGLAALRRE